MKFSDFPLNTEVKIKPIELFFGPLGEMKLVEIKSIVFSGKDCFGKLRFNFYYRSGFAKHSIFDNENQFELFIQDVEKI